MARCYESRTIRYLPSLLLTVSLPLFSLIAFAEPATVSVGADARFSDNVRRSNTNAESDLETRATVYIRKKSDPSDCNSDFSADLGYGVYQNDTYDPQTYTTIDWLGSCKVTERFYWDVSNNTRDVVQDTRDSTTPDNTTRRNIFSTGPRYVIRLSQIDMLQFSAGYENTEYKEPDERDGNRILGSASWNHLFSETFSGGLSLYADKNELDNDQEISRQTASVTFDKQYTTTRLSGSVGVTHLENTFQSFDSESDGWVGNIRLDREITESAFAFIEVSQELTDQTDDYDVEFNGFTYGLRDSSAVTVTALRSGLTKRFSNTSRLNVSVNADRSDYELTGIVEDRAALVVGYSRPVSEFVDINMGAEYAYLTYSDDDSEDNILSLDVGLTYQAAKDLSFDGRIGHNERASTVSNREYDENWILVGVEYRVW
ncbi:outer membrane beta-barrel protein [Marinobacter sp. V034]|uniref:outer membrane beta-barrel protein n=1 Tax=Marinobacter sp. V034 TaxID=3459610 RepID=UPI00404418FF